MYNNQIVEDIKKIISNSDLNKKLQGYKLFLFGSRVTGNNKVKSDIDIGVMGERELPVKTFFELETALEAIPTLLKIDLVDFYNMSDDIKNNALKNIRIIYE